MKRSISKSKVKVYWRSKLYHLLRMPAIMRGILVTDGGHLELLASDWSSYWEDCNLSNQYAEALEKLHEGWQRFIESGFHSQFGENYFSSYFHLLNLALEDKDHDLLAKLISFESFYVIKEGNPMPYVAMTTNFRHPLFALLTARGIRKDDKLDSRRLPILTLAYEGKAYQFYCLTKDKLGRGNNHNLIVFLNTGPEDRSICFNALQPLVGTLHSEWGEFINKRASRISQKVIIPLLEKCPEVIGDNGNVLKVLDVGSGVGMVLSNIIRYMAAKSDTIPKVQARLIDRIAMDPKVQFYSDHVMRHVSSLEYVKDDYKAWFDQFKETYCTEYHIVFIYRLLHTMSEFRLVAEEASTHTGGGPPEVSTYFQGGYLLCNGQCIESDNQSSFIYSPKRIFNLSSLETASGKSIIEKCARLSTWTIIEDLDLNPQSLAEHLKRHNLFDNIYVYDLSKALQLRTNYIYCICSSKSHAPDIGRLIWPG